MRTLLAVKTLSVLNIKQPSVSPMAVFFMPMCLLLLVLSGCAGKEEGIVWQSDKDFVYQSLEHMNEAQGKFSQSSKLSDKRLFELEKKLVKQQTAINAMMATIKAQKSVKHSKLKLKKKFVSKKLKARKTALATKIDKIDSNIQQAVIQSKVDYQPAEKNDYTAAYLALKSGRYDEAIASFQAFLNIYPSGEYTDQAYYWLGESLLAKGEALPAVEAFNTLTQTYPKSSKYQAGLLKLAIAYQQAERLGDAKAVLQRLIDEDPDSKAAERARSRLSALK
ncbi:MAG: tol-pal system protein YbgF [Mariprofundaceae bacterium]|nr:tol-pal system protein YbgF [Mariprofundaceae bacterium]